VFENRVLRNIFGSKKEKVDEELGVLHKTKLRGARTRRFLRHGVSYYSELLYDAVSKYKPCDRSAKQVSIKPMKPATNK
jgi:hypothetical protein